MASFATTLGVIAASGLIILSAANKDTCDHYATVGQSLTLPFVYTGLTNSHVLRWTHNSTIIFYRQQGKVSVGKPADISATGSVFLRNLQFSSAGVYQATVLHSNSTLAATWTARLCVIDKVSKPKLTYDCDPKSSTVTLKCNVANPQGLVFSWTLDGKTLTGETKQKLSVSLAQLIGEKSFTCGVTDKVNKVSSDTVRPYCKSPTPPALLCFTSKTVVAVLAGGAGLILLLLTIIIILCCCHRRHKTQMRPGEREQVRMLSLKQEPDSISPEYETMHPTEDSPPSTPKASPRVCYENVSQPEAQGETCSPQLCTAAEGQQPSPVPKPRTKSPQAANS